MADQDIDLDDLDDFANLYEDDEPAPAAKEEPVKSDPVAEEPEPPPQEEFKGEDTDGFNIKTDLDHDIEDDYSAPQPPSERPIGMKDDGKMFIGGLNWETTDQSLKDYFSQFGEVVDCQVMRDGATGRSRGFGFLTFKDPKTVNIVMVKEHTLDGKLIDPKRAIPREEQERTAKIFVGGVSQECTDIEFRQFFEQFGRVLDATLMMDKDTGRPRGFGFVTFDSDAAVDRVLAQDHEIHNKYIEVKRAEPRGNVRDGDGGGHNKFGRQQRGGGNFSNDREQQNQGGQNGGNNMTTAQAAVYWQNMQNYFKQMQAMTGNAGGGGMNPMAAMQQQAMMQQMMAARGGGGMNPAMMQQMAQMQGNMQGMQGGGSPLNGGAGPQPGFNAQEQLMFEQQKYERQQTARMQSGSFQGGNTWEGMYDDVPPPQGMRGRGGGYAGRGGRGGGTPPQPAGQAPAGAPTGPRNAGMPGANYRGGGRGGRRGFHPYARGNQGM